MPYKFARDACISLSMKQLQLLVTLPPPHTPYQGLMSLDPTLFPILDFGPPMQTPGAAPARRFFCAWKTKRAFTKRNLASETERIF